MHQDCLEQLTRAHLRRTKNREVLLLVLHEAKAPLSPPDLVAALHRAGRRVNKTTIYRDLETLERAGIVNRTMVSDRRQYFELAERGHHHHFICLDCDRIEDVAIEDSGLLTQARSLSEKLKFHIQEHAVEFYGLCQTCQSLK